MSDHDPFGVADHIMKRVTETPSGCWEWTGRTVRGGYGMVTFAGDSGTSTD